MSSSAEISGQLSSNFSDKTVHGDAEERPKKPERKFYALPRWPRCVGIGLHMIVVFSSITIIALVSHSIKSYSSTRNIRFSGLLVSWPNDLNLRPAYFFLISSALSLVSSIALSIYLYLRRNRPSFTPVEVASIIMGLVMSVIWITGDVLQYQSEKTPKKDFLKWSCRRKGSPTNSLVSYDAICDEQVYFFWLVLTSMLIGYRKLSKALPCWSPWSNLWLSLAF